MNDPAAEPTFYEFFAGGGMARAGLGDGWQCAFANDFDHKKGLTYQANWGAPGVLKVGDIRKIETTELPGTADLAWASFPCQDLSLAGGRFEVALVESEPTSAGAERVEFLVAGHAGTTPKPLAKVASGGELARISLAIAVIAATATPVATLIFDEVDAGIGGAVAETVGRLLKQLGQQRQVLCVTHLPQVAARGDQHFVVSKSMVDARPVSRIAALERKARVEELARMLGGVEITETTRKHAREMLAA